MTHPLIPQATKAMTGSGLPAKYRLKSRADFQRVFATRQSVADDVLRLHACACQARFIRGWGCRSPGGWGTRCAVIATKRLLREAFRLSRDSLPPLDLVVIPQGRRTPELAEFSASLVSLARRLEKRLARRKA